MKKMTGESTNITEENLSVMRQLFPEAFEEGKIDLDVLRQLLGDYVDDEEERYSFKWNGKGRALRLSQTPSTGTLRPCKEESVDWDTTQNLYIEGDNLEVLKLLQKSYHGRVKMIYIDPPYNTGSDFVYKDDFRDNVENYKRITGQVDGEGHRIGTNNESNGRFHTDWLNMMYPRLRLARNLLADDGVIFISIDDNEVDNLKKICDEVFGEGNFTATIVWQKVHTRKNSAINFSSSHEYVLCYAKKRRNSSTDLMGWKRNLLPRENTDNYSNPDNDPKGAWKADPITAHNYYAADYTITKPNGEVIYRPQDRYWTYSEETLKRLIKENAIIWGEGRSIPMVKRYLSDTQNGLVPVTLFTREFAGDTAQAKRQIDGLFPNCRAVFDYPKSIDLLYRLAQIAIKPSDIILDFFSGSATTAHAVMQMNAEDGGNRRFIMVQLPEPTPETSEAAKAGYANICEIGKERIRRAGEKVKAECADAERAAALDVGFKVFKLDSSNLQKWQPQPEDLMASLEASMDNFLPDRTALDVVYEIALKLGLDLSYEVEKRKVDDHTVCVIGAGALMICLDSQISMNTAEALLRLHEEYEPETWQVVFRDTGFLSDQEKTNIKETLKSAGLDEDAFISI